MSSPRKRKMPCVLAWGRTMVCSRNQHACSIGEGIYGIQSLFLPGSGLHVQQWSHHGTVSPSQKLALQTTAMKISYQASFTERLAPQSVVSLLFPVCGIQLKNISLFLRALAETMSISHTGNQSQVIQTCLLVADIKFRTPDKCVSSFPEDRNNRKQGRGRAQMQYCYYRGLFCLYTSKPKETQRGVCSKERGLLNEVVPCAETQVRQRSKT